MPAPRKDLLGTKHHHLLIIGRKEKRAPSGKLVTVWHCRCTAQGVDCRLTCDVEAGNISRTLSCGCLKREPKPNPNRKAVPIRIITPELRAKVLRVRNQGKLCRTWDPDPAYHYRTTRSTYHDIWLELSSENLTYDDIAGICRSAEESDRQAEDAAYAENLRARDGLPPSQLPYCCDDPTCEDCAGKGDKSTRFRRFAKFCEPFRIGFERAEQPTGNLYDPETERDCAMRRERWRLAREIASR